MAITINGGTGVITGVSVGGLPDGIVDSGTLATNSVDSAELIDGAVDDSHMAAMAASKLTGALPAISGASLTGVTSFAQAPVVHHQTGGGGSLTDSWPPPKRYNGLTVDITPTSASNKILIYFQQQQRIHQTAASSVAGSDAFHNYLIRGTSGTTIGSVAASVSGFGGTQTQIWSQEFNLWTKTTTQIDTQIVSYWYLDSPSTTSLCRYFSAVTNSGNNEHISWKVDTGTAQMYAIEIKL